ncbi:MAG: DNA-binding protein WhiA [Lachnospiraceae bacterium]|nr:DNA-binding protein WhiA [Lachnospiraceae bacterium]
MSFSTDLKEELAGKIPAKRHCCIAELSAFMYYGGTAELRDDGSCILIFSTEKENIAKKCFTFLRKSYNMNIVAGVTPSANRAGTAFYVRAEGGREVRNCIEEMGFEVPARTALGTAEPLADWPFHQPKADCCARSFARGCFLMGGAINNPEKSYHFEISAPTASFGEILIGVFERFGCEPKLWERRGSYAVYLKDADQVADALTIIDSTAARVRFEDIRVVRSKRAEVQRKVNCEVFNIGKTMRAANRQIEAIERISQTTGLQGLPEELREMAELRIRYPEASLTELGKYTVPPLGRSGVNHRLQKLCEIAEGLRLKEGG